MSKKYIGNLVQSLSGGSGGGGDTGVGKPYPGSTGGEYFNYYGDDSDKNTAEGDYSTTIGKKNVTSGIHSFTGGYNNINNSENCFIFGQNNQTHKVSTNQYCMVVGKGNKCSDNDARECIVLGDSNNVVESRQLRILGDYNYIPNDRYRYSVLVGNRCANTPTLAKPIVTIACGDQYAAISKNAIEIDGTECKILNNLQLNADTTSVNAITTPQDPNNITTDDQTLATKSYVDANSGSGGVGQAYSGSTGGEIFNYYGTDSNANEASGDYSTTIGYNNKNAGTCSFCGGKNNYLDTNYTPSFIFGDNNGTSGQRYGNCIVLGHNNKGSGQGAQFYIMGKDNTINYPGGIVIANKASAYGGYYFGEGVKAISTQNILQCVIGLYNAGTTLPNPRFAIGVGTSSERITALEMNKTVCKINNKLQLASDGTEVNAITPPQDPQNVTADDQTLVTKSYLTSQIPSLTHYSKSQVAYFEEWDNATIIPVDGSSISLTTFGTIPTWSNRAIITFRWENELITKEVFFNKNEGIHLHIVQRAYSTFPETINYKHMRIEWDYTNNNLTAADFWTYDQDMSNAGAISNWSHTLSNATTCKILSVVFSE